MKDYDRSSLAAGCSMIRIRDVQVAAARVLGVPLEVMTSRRRAGARHRQLAIRVARDITGRSLSVLGRFFGGRDHTTMLGAIVQVECRMLRQPALAETLAAIAAEATAEAARFRAAMLALAERGTRLPDPVPPRLRLVPLVPHFGPLAERHGAAARRPKGNGRGHKWQLDAARVKRVRGMLSNGYTVAEMARSLCVSQETLAARLREAGMHPDQVKKCRA